MRFEDLPRLSDEDRHALDDGYVAIEGVPASPPPQTIASPIAILFAIAAACIFFLGVALHRFDERLTAIEAAVGIEQQAAVVEDFR